MCLPFISFTRYSQRIYFICFGVGPTPCVLSSLDREVRARKCLRCGSEAHRQKDCVVGKGVSKATGGGGKDGSPTKPAVTGSSPSTQSTMATLGTTSTSPSATLDTVPGTPWTLESLVQAAQQMVQGQSQEGQGSETSPEKTRPTMRVLKLRDIRVCSMEASTTALLDSGATHSLRSARSEEEWFSAEEVGVQLAGSHTLVMRITGSGTLLMPYKSTADGQGEVRAQTIVPMGQLIKTLGYTMVWSPEECYLSDEAGNKLPLQVSGGCPQLKELEALALIARLEDRKLEQLQNETLLTKDRLSLSAMAMEVPWNHYLYDYVTKGAYESGLRAVRDAPFFEDIPGGCLEGLVPIAGLWSGWDIMKEVCFLSRAQRRRLLTSKRWVVHLFAGREGHWEIMKLDQGDTTVIELDLARNAGQDLFRTEVWRMLLWGAKEGKVDVIMGGPPGRAQQHLKGGVRDVKSLKLVARMMWLFAVAQVGREADRSAVNKNRDVGFILEYPEGRHPRSKEEMEQRVQRAEEDSRGLRNRGEGASWDHSIQYWENVQRPRWLAMVGSNTVDASHSFWETRMWKAFEKEAELCTVSFDQGAMGSATRNRTSLGTNIHSLMSLENLRVDEDDPMPERGDCDHVWSPGLVNSIVVAMNFWERSSRCTPRLQAMTPLQWKQHVDSNHAVYRRDCATCVMSRGTGRQHRRVHHPDTYVLTADVAGPLAKGLDSTSKGTLGKNLKYLLVAKYMVPKAFVEAYSGKLPPEDDGVAQVKPTDDHRQNDDEDIFGDFAEEGDKAQEHTGEVEVMEFPDGEAQLSAEALEELQEYVPSDPEDEEEQGDEAKDLEVEPTSGDVTMQYGDCVPPELTYLVFAAALPNNQSRTVRAALQDIMLYLQVHGMPVYRFHADKGEFYNNLFKTWLREQGILGTWSEPSMPQSNGHAEQTVKWVKDRTRTLLRAAGMPTRLWPAAAAAAAAEQRAKVLNWKSSLAAPFGAKVHLRKKPFDKYGPLRREHGMESKWTTGQYAGLSTVVHNGHLVYIPGEGEEAEKFLHTLHVRPNLVDPGKPEEEFKSEPPRPLRKVVMKTPVEEIQMRPLAETQEEPYQEAVHRAKTILDSWSRDAATQLIQDLAKEGFFEKRKFGVFRHGGMVGWLTGLREFPIITKVLVRYIVQIAPEAVFTSVLVTCDAQKGMHRDTNNDFRTKNYVVPVVVPSRGGELWIELKPGDIVKGNIEQREAGNQRLYGQLEQLQQGECIAFDPSRYHEVTEWEGVRINVIAYTPDCLGKLSQDDLELLHDYEFPVPLSQLPEFHGNPQPVRDGPQVMQAELLHEVEEEAVEGGWSMYLDLEPGLVKIADQAASGGVHPRVYKTEVNYTPDIEDVISKLTGPLDVTHTVRTEDVMKNLEAWRPAILKEIAGIESAIVRLVPGSAERAQWFNKAGVQRLPMKFVFTLKPNDKAVQHDPGTWFKRKARLVICGNMAINEGNPLYTETAPAEVVRAGLSIASRNSWSVAILDIVAAFLKTPLGRSKTDPVVVAQPPRLLEAMGLAVRMEMWGLIKALYGLREAPMLWGNFRDDTLRVLPLPRSLSWNQGKAITAWWTIRNSTGDVEAIVIVYVDDFMICGPRNLVEELSEAIQKVWDTSELTFLGHESSVRFLGMELHRAQETHDEIFVQQHGYISELLRLHGVKETQLDKVPITKDLAVIPEVPEGADELLIREAQQLTGEILWVTQRTRPDLAFTSSLMATMSTRNPSQAVAIGRKALGYLRRTIDYTLLIKWNQKSLTMFCDAAFAPQGGRSHSGWLVTYGGVPLTWRSGRQSMITLSTAESELLAILDGAIALRGVEAILSDAGEHVDSRHIESDSTSALSITTGASSWRTRHLRIKAGWLQEQLLDGHFQVGHCPGEVQPADLLTKALSSARMEHLLRLWGIGTHEPSRSTTRTIPASTSRMMVALLCCLLMVSVQAAESDQSGNSQAHSSGIQLDYDSVGILMILLMILGAMMIWEGLRWVLIEAVTSWTPGASQRKLRRLRKLQKATAEAIEQELERLQEEPTRSPTQAAPPLRTRRAPQTTVEQSGSSSSGQRVTSPVRPRTAAQHSGLDGAAQSTVEQEQPSSSTARRRMKRTYEDSYSECGPQAQ